MFVLLQFVCDSSLEAFLRPLALGFNQIRITHAVAEGGMFSFATESVVDLVQVFGRNGAVAGFECGVDEVNMEEAVLVGVHPAALCVEVVAVVVVVKPVVELFPVCADGGVTGVVDGGRSHVDDALGAVFLALERRVMKLVVEDACAESRVDFCCLKSMEDLLKRRMRNLEASLFQSVVGQVVVKEAILVRVHVKALTLEVHRVSFVSHPAQKFAPFEGEAFVS